MEKNQLITRNIPGLLAQLAAPAICAQIVTLLYNLVDRIYIGQMTDGITAMAAIGICAPIITVITSFSSLFGRGGSPLASIELGRNHKQNAEKYLGCSFIMLIISSVVLTAVILLFGKDLLVLFGATENSLPFALDYINIYCLGTILVALTVGMNYYITAQGFARTAMITTLSGCLINIVLDPLFIFTFNMGVKGAALATILSQIVSCIWVMVFLLSERSVLKLHKENMLFPLQILKDILILGSASFFMNLSEGVVNICFNKQVLLYGGDVAVSAMTILFSIFQFMLLPVEGVAQGSQPIISYNYGAGRYDRVKATIRLAAIVTVTFTFLATTAIMLFPQIFIRIFNSDPSLLEIGVPMLRIYVGGLFILGLNSTFQQSYNSLGKGGRAFFFAFFRKFILLIPLIYLLPSVLPYGLYAVILAEPVSDVITTVTNTISFRSFLNHLLHEQSYTLCHKEA